MTIRQAERFLGEDGAVKLRQGGRNSIDASADIKIIGDTLSCKVPDPEVAGGFARVTIVEKSNRPDGLQFNCDACGVLCNHIAQTLA